MRSAHLSLSLIESDSFFLCVRNSSDWGGASCACARKPKRNRDGTCWATKMGYFSMHFLPSCVPCVVQTDIVPGLSQSDP